ncbi:COMM domain-containing protein 10 isoform X1 [Octopus bimaculoides]|uniref:COMM domain-containing protein n=1 Tax=Octopus bimaculoides TaxID=37653 RepID=A0A0L8HS12_OCTBM|nr:COMM domain-containing protein 10 isoform X1 [Octopus bimaculoides]|eukprot:XP_014769908.1 PREDICTED: COMM domain-containing protein 10-like [Octopus bimaculoides]
MALLFSSTPSIQKAVSFINNLDPKLFTPILSRILQKIDLKDERSFTEEEESKLEQTLDLPAADLELMIQSLEFFLQQAAYHSAKPAVLKQQLEQLEINEDKIQAIVEAWSTHAKEILQKLRQRTLVPDQLNAINWRLNLEMANGSRSKMKQPNAMFELKINREGKQNAEKLQLEFSHQELYTFYNQLETIQKQLDNLD